MTKQEKKELLEFLASGWGLFVLICFGGPWGILLWYLLQDDEE